MERTPSQMITLPVLKTRLNVERASIILLVMSYLAGIFGILIPVHEKFILLTPFNLLLSLGVALLNHPRWSKHTLVFLGLSYVLGFGAELFGVQTGILFGDYAYGPVLGPKIWGTPFMIGINWMLVAYTSGVCANYLAGRAHWIGRAVLGALLLVFLDWFIEPVAMYYDFWSWEENVVPLRNYIGWFLVALPLQIYFAYYQRGIKNKAAGILFILQLLFFVILGIAIHF